MVNSYRYAFAATTSDIPSTGTTVDLGVGQLGVFDGKTFAATSGVSAKSILIAQGTPDSLFPQGASKGNQTYKTDIIKGSNVKSWKVKKASRGKGMITTMGFDGADLTKNLTVKKGEAFTFWVTLSGSPIANLLGNSPKTHYAVWTEQFTIQLPCVSECVDTCGETVDPNIVGDAVLAEFAKRKIIGGQYLTDYVKATKLVSCDTPSGLPTVSYTVVTLTIPDTGDAIALGKVQAQYPGVKIKRSKRDGVYSTYEAVVADGVTLTDFSSEGLPVVPTCDSCPSGCPSGYTLQSAQDVYIVQRPLSANTDLHNGTARTAFAEALEAAYSATASEFLSYNGSVATVKLYFATGTSVSALLSDSVVLVETNAEICTQTSPTTTAWVECKTCVAAKKTFVITIKDDCNVDALAELEAIYGSGVTLVTQNTDTCTAQYSLEVESDNKDCDSCAEVLWQFSAPKPFKGLVWTEVLGETGYGVDCNIGIEFKSIYEQRKTKECFLNQVAYEFEPLFISVSTRNPDPNDYSVLCGSDVPVTVTQNVEYPFGLGRTVAAQVIETNYNFNQPWRKNPAERDALEYELGIDLNGYYDQYIIEYVTHPDTFGASHFGTTQTQSMEASFYFNEGTGAAFESVVSAFLAGTTDIVLEQI